MKKYPFKYINSVPHVLHSKGLYDAVDTTNSGKRLRIEMIVGRETIGKDEVKSEWITKGYQLADIPTKKGSSDERLMEVLENSKIASLDK